MKRSIVRLALLGLLGAGTFANGAGLIIIDDSSGLPQHVLPPWPGPDRPIWRPHPFAPLEVQSVKVQTRINDQIAVTRIDQEFFNPNAARLEGTFVFPIPKGAHLDKFAMDIDGKPVEAELLSADKARHIY